MLNKIKQFFDEHIAEHNPDYQHGSFKYPSHPLQAIQIATAALFVEMIHQDGKILIEEKNTAKNALISCFNLSHQACDELFQLAETEISDATDYYQFTYLINQHFGQIEKIKIIEHLWEIAYSDEDLDEMEEHMVRKIAELLHVPHRHFIQTKLRVLNNDQSIVEE